MVAKRPETVEVFNIFWDYLRYSTLLYVGGDAGLDFTVRYTNTIYKILKENSSQYYEKKTVEQP